MVQKEKAFNPITVRQNLLQKLMKILFGNGRLERVDKGKDFRSYMEHFTEYQEKKRRVLECWKNSVYTKKNKIDKKITSNS